MAAIGCFVKTDGRFRRCWLWSWEYGQGVCQAWNSWLGSSHKISYNGADGPGHHPASSRMLFLCGCRAVPKAKLSFQKEGKKKNTKPKSSDHPSLDRLLLRLEITQFQCSATAWTETRSAPHLANLVPEKASLFSL